jgi:hypothetical protein
MPSIGSAAEDPTFLAPQAGKGQGAVLSTAIRMSTFADPAYYSCLRPADEAEPGRGTIGAGVLRSYQRDGVIYV